MHIIPPSSYCTDSEPGKKVTPEFRRSIIAIATCCLALSDIQVGQHLQAESGARLPSSTVSQMRQLAHFEYLLPKRCQVLTDRQLRQGMQFTWDFSRENRGSHYPKTIRA
jgi:hypothetical protein